ncbi:hypothetical protein TELCIR_15431, partial [Teladorsagia circumcincta]
MQLFSLTDSRAAHRRITKAFAEWRSCMKILLDNTGRNPSKVWMDIPKITNFCVNTTDVRRIKLTLLVNGDEVKRGIISNGSEFFGADPVTTTNAHIFGRIGKFFPVAVSNLSGLSYSTIRADNGSYVKRTVAHVHLATFLTQMVNRTRIDNLLMDNEGPEYDLIPMITIDNVLPEKNIVICQMNVEFHNWVSKGRPCLPNVMSGMLQQGRYAHTMFMNTDRLVKIDCEDCGRKYSDTGDDVAKENFSDSPILKLL